MGAGVLPRHLIQAVDEEGEKLHVFKGSNKHLVNTISMATVRGRTLPPSVTGLTDFLVDKLRERQMNRS
jgi:DNA-binding transcriptional LysR family regulator